MHPPSGLIPRARCYERRTSVRDGKKNLFYLVVLYLRPPHKNDMHRKFAADRGRPGTALARPGPLVLATSDLPDDGLRVAHEENYLEEKHDERESEASPRRNNNMAGGGGEPI